MVKLMLVFGVVLIGLGLVLMLTPGPSAMLLFPGVGLVIAALGAPVGRSPSPR